jgi:hypothetical protein
MPSGAISPGDPSWRKASRYLRIGRDDLRVVRTSIVLGRDDLRVVRTSIVLGRDDLRVVRTAAPRFLQAF